MDRVTSNNTATPPSAERLSAGVAALFVVVVAAAARPIVDPDFWWHLRTGKLIVEEGIPSADPYSYTVAGRSWITHEWLSEVLLWGVYEHVGGPAGLIVLFTAVTTAAFWLAWRISEANPTHTAVIAAVASWAAAVATGVRPQMFNLLGLAIVLAACEGVRRRPDRASRLWALVPLSILWTNLHSGFVLGIVVLGVYAVAARVERQRKAGLTVLAISVMCFVAAIVNPSGAAMWRYPFDTLRSPVMRDFIAEWASPNFHAPQFAPFLVLLVVSLVAVVSSTRPLPVAHGLLLIGTGVASVQSIRHIPIFAIVAIPTVSPHVSSALDRIRNRTIDGDRKPTAPRWFHRSLSGLAAAVALVVTATAVSANDAAFDRSVPVAAVDYLESTGLAGEPGLNQYRFGGYLIWRDIPVFVDGRADVYGDDFLSEYVATHRVTPEWRQALDEFDVQWVIVEPEHDLATMLGEARDWDRSFTSEQAAIYERLDSATGDSGTASPGSLAFGGE